MPRGKYEELCLYVLQKTKAQAVLLVAVEPRREAIIVKAELDHARNEDYFLTLLEQVVKQLKKEKRNGNRNKSDGRN